MTTPSIAPIASIPLTWSFDRNGQLVGPFSLSEIHQLLTVGIICAETVVVQSNGLRQSAAECLQLPPSPPRRQLPGNSQFTLSRPGASAEDQSVGDNGQNKSKGMIQRYLESVPVSVQTGIVWWTLLPILVDFLLVVVWNGPRWIHSLSILLTAPAWFFAGGQAVWTGVVYSFRGNRHFRPVLYRILGIGLVLMGIGVGVLACGLLLSGPQTVSNVGLTLNHILNVFATASLIH